MKYFYNHTQTHIHVHSKQQEIEGKNIVSKESDVHQGKSERDGQLRDIDGAQQ